VRVVYGINPVLEAIKSAGRVERVFISRGRPGASVAKVAARARAQKIDVATVAGEELDRLAGTANHQGVVALFTGEFAYSDIEDLIGAWKKSGESALFLVLDSVQDPQNLGSLVRAAHASGAHGVIIPKDRACQITPAVAKASAGATEHTPIAREVNLVRVIERLKQEGVWAAAVEADCKNSIYGADLDRDLAIVIGSEGRGIRRLVRESCDLHLSIPMAGAVNSLNAAQAGAIALFEARRQKLCGKAG